MKRSSFGVAVAITFLSLRAHSAEPGSTSGTASSPAPGATAASRELDKDLDSVDAALGAWIKRAADAKALAEVRKDSAARANAESELERLVRDQQQLAALRRSLAQARAAGAGDTEKRVQPELKTRVDSIKDDARVRVRNERVAYENARARQALKISPPRPPGTATTERTSPAVDDAVEATEEVRAAKSSWQEDAAHAENIEQASAVLDTPPAGAAAAPPLTPAPTSNDIEFENGGSLRYGLSLSVLRFTTSRQPSEPARLRNYTPALELLPAEIGFQFVYRPGKRPWRLTTKGDGKFQLLSAGGMLLARIDNTNFARGGISIAGTIGLFEDAIGVGIGIDLYRGIPVQGPDGTSGGATAYTGLLAWGFAREGELTAENLFAVISLNLSEIALKLQGQVR